ncbi:hypothetical protein K8I31_13780 [bacterium]|nr:hypothetical protein [bacterium]
MSWARRRLHEIRHTLDASWLPYGLALLPLLLIAHSFNDGWYGDDFVQRVWLVNSPETNETAAALSPSGAPPANRFSYSLFELFTFADGGPRVQHWIERGLIPWWTHPELRIRFFRPLAGITHWLDYQLWPQSPLMMHIQNALWMLLMLAAAVAVLRLMLPPKVALLAAALFALNECLAGAAWIAGRNALLAAAFVFAAIYFHHGWRNGEKRCFFYAMFSLIAALLSSESGVGAFCYLLAYELFLSQGLYKKRGAALAPYLAVLIVWKVLYVLLGYGVAHTDLYIDPLNAAQFIPAVIFRYPALLRTLLFPNAFEPYSLLFIWCVVLIGCAAAPVIKQNATARFFLLGMLLSLLPACSHAWGVSVERLFYLSAFGASGLFAVVAAYWFQRAPASLSVRIVIASLVVCMMMLSANSMFTKSSKPLQEQRDLVNAVSPYNEFTLQSGGAAFLFGTPNSTWHFYYPFLNASASRLAAYNLLPDLNYEIELIDENQMVVSMKKVWRLNEFDSVWRDRISFHFEEGRRIYAGEFEVVVLKVDEDGSPRKLQFNFRKPMADSNYYWRQWRMNHWQVLHL